MLKFESCAAWPIVIALFRGDWVPAFTSRWNHVNRQWTKLCSTASGAFQGSDENLEKKGKEPRSQDSQISSARKCILSSGYIHFQVAGVEATWLPQMFDGLSCVVCEFGVECTPMSALSIPKAALRQLQIFKRRERRLWLKYRWASRGSNNRSYQQSRLHGSRKRQAFFLA